MPATGGIGTGTGNPTDVLTLAFERAEASLTIPIISDQEVIQRIELVARSSRNRACIRFLLACTLAKSVNPSVDIRKPYTEIGTSDAYSGRMFDERFIGPFVHKHQLDCNPTTAFLTPAFRNITTPLMPDTIMAGSPPQVYEATLHLLTDVQTGKVTAENVLAETLRWLLLMKDERLARLEQALESLRFSETAIPLSSEDIVKLIEQHLTSPYSSRLPVLVVAAAYKAAEQNLSERVLPLHAHNAADLQTKSLGDVQIALTDDDNVVTVYEMKAKNVEIEDINIAIEKLKKLNHRIDNYIFITTDEISLEVKNYAASLYKRTGGMEFVVLDCLEFIRHFLHLFHRIRINFLDAYQELVLAEPDSAVRQELKIAFLALRHAYESAYSPDETTDVGEELD
jgi:hypothetical protein